MRILALDSSGLVASVAYTEDGVLKGEYTVNNKKTHSETLMPMLDAMGQMAGMDLGALDAIAVSKGPGSFTGLRIGSATVKGLGLALNKPIVAVPTVEAIAYNLWGISGIVCPIMDARRDQVYTGLYCFNPSDSGYEMEVIREECAVSIGEIVDDINNRDARVTFLGDGVPVFRDYIADNCKVAYAFAPAHMNRQRAGSIASLAEIYYNRGIYESAAEHRPEYLRKSQAEREREGQSAC